MSFQHKSPKREIGHPPATDVPESNVPTSLKIKKISEKLLSGTKLRSDQQEKIARQAQRLRVLDQKLQRAQVPENLLHTSIKEQLSKLHEGLLIEKSARELLEDKKSKELKLLENTLSLEVAMATKNHKEIENELQLRIDREFNELRQVLQNSHEQHDNLQQQHSAKLQAEVAFMFAMLEEQKKSIEESQLNSAKLLNEELHKLEQTLKEERRVRDKTEATLLQMLQDTFYKLQNELQNERKNRETAEETILKILEEVCDTRLSARQIKS